MTSFEERLAALEAQAAANQLPATLALLQRKLEATWQPDAGVLLQPGSVVLSLLGMAAGAATLTWTAGAAYSNVVTVSHGLPGTPKVFPYSQTIPSTPDLIVVNPFTVGATTFQIQAKFMSGTWAAGGNHTIGWLAVL